MGPAIPVSALRSLIGVVRIRCHQMIDTGTTVVSGQDIERVYRLIRTHIRITPTVNVAGDDVRLGTVAPVILPGPASPLPASLFEK